MAYNLLRPVPVFSAVSMATSLTSAAVEIKNQDNLGVQFHWVTSDGIGTFGVQISSDHMQDAEGNITVSGNWVTLPLTPAITSASANDDAYVDLNQLSAQYLRVIYTRVSGTGTLSAIVIGKGV